VSGPVGSEERPNDNSASLRLRTGPLAAGVLCRVVSMMLARADCPLDRLDDAMLLCDALCAHAQTHVSDGYLSCQIAVLEGDLRLSVDELSPAGAQGLVADAVLPVVGNVLEHVTDELRIGDDPGAEQLFMRLSFA
jgi:serine/threonine-protein kinase RsbW